jgi:pimeloyl-ACP methyl ester carboxylesterase
MKTWWWALVAGVLAAAALARPFVIRRLKPRLRFEYSRRALRPEEYAKLGARPGWATIMLQVAPDASLRGLIRRPADAARAHWIVFYPGNDFTQLERGQRMLDYLRGERDEGLLLFADRGYDGSTGTTSPATMASDGLRMLDVLLETEHVEPSRVNVIGFSLGGFVACAAASGAAKRGQKVATLSLLASVTKVEMNPSGLWARLALGDMYDILPFEPDLPAPILVVHGTADSSLPLAASRDLAARLGARATFVEIPGAAHELPDNHAALDQVRALIDSPRAR